ncbi:hypothetical protein COBT_001254 [Conglomerata obtusa]
MCTTLALTFHIYNHYKLKKLNVRSKQYPYIFILLALLTTTEQTFSFIIRIFPFYDVLKLVLVVVICFPYTNMAQKIYKEYLQRAMDSMEDRIDCSIGTFGGRWRCIIIEAYDKIFEMFNKEKLNGKDEIEFKAIETKNIECIDEGKIVDY